MTILLRLLFVLFSMDVVWFNEPLIAASACLFQCEKCSASFDCSADLLEHDLLHVQEAENKKPYGCDWCEQTFYNQKSLDRHQKGRHKAALAETIAERARVGLDAVGDFLCDLCGRAFFTSEALNDHSAHGHLDVYSGNKRVVETSFPCQYPRCQEVFDNITALVGHVQSHLKRGGSNVPPNMANQLLLLCSVANGEAQPEGEAGGTIINENHIACSYAGCSRVFYRQHTFNRHIQWHERQEAVAATEEANVPTAGADDEHDQLSPPSGTEKLQQAEGFGEEEGALLLLANDQSFKCDVPGCQSVYRYKRGLSEHKRKCHNAAVIVVSNEAAEAVADVEQPVQDVAVSRFDEIFKCDNCEQTFKTHRGLASHQSRSHKIPARYRCGFPRCTQCFDDEVSWVSHIQTHVPAVPAVNLQEEHISNLVQRYVRAVIAELPNSGIGERPAHGEHAAVENDHGIGSTGEIQQDREEEAPTAITDGAVDQAVNNIPIPESAGTIEGHDAEVLLNESRSGDNEQVDDDADSTESGGLVNTLDYVTNIGTVFIEQDPASAETSAQAEPAGIRLACDECTRIFTKQASLTRHKNVHKKNKSGPFECRFSGCEEAFDDINDYSTHSLQHQRKRAQIMVPEVRQDEDIVQVAVNKKEFKCTYPGCARVFLRRNCFANHVKWHGRGVAVEKEPDTEEFDAEEEQKFACDDCDCFFSTMRCLVRHKSITHKKMLVALDKEGAGSSSAPSCADSEAGEVDVTGDSLSSDSDHEASIPVAPQELQVVLVHALPVGDDAIATPRGTDNEDGLAFLDDEIAAALGNAPLPNVSGINFTTVFDGEA